MQLLFGIGALWGTRSDISGIGPDQFAILQENTIEFNYELKELYSQLQFPVDIARGKGKITGKAKTARVYGALYADIFFGQSYGTGEVTVTENENPTLATNLYTVVNSANYVADLGINYSTGGGLRFLFVTGTPTAAGTYTTGTNGVYTFFTGDIGAGIFVSYVNTVSGVGKIMTLTNQFMGYTPTFIGTFYSIRNTLNGSGQLTLRLFECVSERLTFPSRIDDYNIPDLDFMAFANNANQIGTLSTTE